jgi:hypothetical protein
LLADGIDPSENRKVAKTGRAERVFWRMGRPYSIDLRERAVARIQAGETK